MDEFDKLLEAFSDYFSAKEEYAECVSRAGREADYYCHREGEDITKAKVDLKTKLDNYVKALSSEQPPVKG